MMEVASELSAAAWVRERIVTFAQDVGSLVPACFEAYARVLHPASPGEVRWADIARQLGRTIHPEVQFQNVATPLGMLVPDQQHEVECPWECPPPGTLHESLRNQLGSVLSRFTTSSDRVWFALWEGYGGLPPRPRPGRPLLDLPNRQYLVYVGPLSDLPSWRWEGPNLWWPDDRAWFVASEIDLVSTYVGGSAAAVAELLHDPLLEVVPSSVTDRITADADRVNV